MKKVKIEDVEQRLDILGELTSSVVHLENSELSKKLSAYKADNVAWVLNMVMDGFNEIQDALDFEYSSHQGY